MEIPPETAHTHILHIVAGTFAQAGFSSSQAEPLTHTSHLLEAYLANLFESTQAVAQQCGRSQATASDLIESLSASFLERVSPEFADVDLSTSQDLTQNDSSNGAVHQADYEKQLQSEKEDMRQACLKQVIFDSYVQPLNGFKRYIWFEKDRRRHEGIPLESLPLRLPLCAPAMQEAETLSLSDSEINVEKQGTTQFNSHARASKRRKISTTSTRHSEYLLGQENMDKQSHKVTPNAISTSTDCLITSKTKDNKKPNYMTDVEWLPRFPARHRWRKTFEVQHDSTLSTTGQPHLSTKTLEYLTASVETCTPAIDVLPKELASVNHHVSRNSNSLPVLGDRTVTTPDGPLLLSIQGSNISLGDDIFITAASVITSRMSTGKLKRKRWITAGMGRSHEL